jgi:peptidoglycan hydrolase CwlO-like protein
MNDAEERKLISTTKNAIIKAVVSAVITCAIGLTAFYFTSTATLAQHTKKIDNLESEVKKVTTVPVLNQYQIKHIQKELAEFKDQYKEDSKENKDAIKELRKQNQQMIELLYQIRNKN